MVLADIQAGKGEAAAQSLREAGGEATFVACDVGDRGQVEALVAKTVEAYGGLDVMISNAAVLHPADVLELEEEDFDRVVRMNLKGFFLTGQAAARQMVAQGRGEAIIHMSSIQAYITNANLLSCTVCKGGVGVAPFQWAVKGSGFMQLPGSSSRRRAPGGPNRCTEHGLMLRAGALAGGVACGRPFHSVKSPCRRDCRAGREIESSYRVRSVGRNGRVKVSARIGRRPRCYARGLPPRPRRTNP